LSTVIFIFPPLKNIVELVKISKTLLNRDW
jgi:hypothetical protein